MFLSPPRSYCLAARGEGKSRWITRLKDVTLLTHKNG